MKNITCHTVKNINLNNLQKNIIEMLKKIRVMLTLKKNHVSRKTRSKFKTLNWNEYFSFFSLTLLAARGM